MAEEFITLLDSFCDRVKLTLEEIEAARRKEWFDNLLNYEIVIKLPPEIETDWSQDPYFIEHKMKVICGANWKQYGLSGLSEAALEEYNRKLVKDDWEEITQPLVARAHHLHDPILVKIIKKLGPAANTDKCTLRIVKIPEQYRNYYYFEVEDGKEVVVCDPGRILHEEMREDVDFMTDRQCKEFLQRMSKIAHQEITRY